MYVYSLSMTCMLSVFCVLLYVRTYICVSCITSIALCVVCLCLLTSVFRDLYWEYHYHVLEYIPDLQEPTDSSLKEYKLPEKIEQFIEEKRYDNMERTITRVCGWT